jgi:glycosyltransferase involved in cell wall biosynthesis
LWKRWKDFIIEYRKLGLDLSSERKELGLMKILIVTPFFPYKGVTHAAGKFLYETIKRLSGKYDIYLFSRIEPEEIKFLREMEEFCRNVKIFRFKTASDSNPFKMILIIISYLIFAIKTNRTIRRGNFDIVQVEHTQTGVLIDRKKDTKMILVAYDVMTKPAERRYLSSRGYIQKIVNLLKWQVTKIIEIYISRKFDIVYTMSQIDKEILLSLVPDLRINVIPLAIETCEYPSNVERAEDILLFAGAIHREVNQEAVIYFYKEVFPFIRQEIPDIKFYVVGNNPPENIKSLAVNDQNVIVTGYVESLTPYYQRATVFVSPILIGGGIIAKNLNAMANGLPVVTTSIGNEGIKAVPDREIIIADTPKEFAEKVIMLMNDRELRAKISEAGKRFVGERFNLNQVIDMIDRIWESDFKLGNLWC